MIMMMMEMRMMMLMSNECEYDDHVEVLSRAYIPCGMVGALRRNTFSTGGSDGGRGSCFLYMMITMAMMMMMMV